MQDFYGFEYNGVHSSELNIVRVSDGSRYNDILLPSFQDIIEQKVGSDGTLYWESFYTNKPIPISIAFDSLTEINYRKLRQLFDGKKTGTLIFDECPYKVYNVKLQSPLQLNTICFVENGQRIYKGEGSMQFISYSLYAKNNSQFKYLEQAYALGKYDNIGEWADASGMLEKKEDYDGTNLSTIKVYNAGDIETDWKAYIPFTNSSIANFRISNRTSTDPNSEINFLLFSSISKINTNDTYICVNSKTNLIEGCDSNKKPTGSLYNRHITAGDFFKLPLLTSYMNFGSVTCNELEYNYLYY